MKSKNPTEAQRMCFYKFPKDTNLKECEKVSGPQFAVFDCELKETQKKKAANVIPSIKWREVEQFKAEQQLHKGINDHLISYEPSA